MPNPMQPQNTAQKNAEHYFKKPAQQRDESGKQTRMKKRANMVTIASELHELRRAKAAAEEVAVKLAAENAAAEPGLQHKRAPIRPILRMNY
jgi:hypothetical protein